MKDADISFSGDEVLRLHRPSVYVWSRGDCVLYVGVATKGASRPFDSSHHRLHRIEPEDRLEMFLCTSESEAVQLERELIIALHPKLNSEPMQPRTLTSSMRRPTTVARKHGIPVSDVLRACALGDLPAMLFGESWRIEAKDAAAWAAEMRAGDPDGFLSVSMAAKEFAIDGDALRTWIRKGVLPHYRVGPEPGVIRVRRGDVAAVA